MSKSKLALLIAAALVMGGAQTAMAAPKPFVGCSPTKVAGSYIRNRADFQYIDTLILDAGGGAYWYQSTAFDFLIGAGTYIPEVGSWKCFDDGTLVVTTIGTSYVPTGSGDIQKDSNDRFTQKLFVADNSTLNVLRRVDRSIPLSDDPLDPDAGTVNFDSTGGPDYKRVPVFTSDLQ